MTVVPKDSVKDGEQKERCCAVPLPSLFPREQVLDDDSEITM
jgi:hypothetical protein